MRKEAGAQQGRSSRAASNSHNMPPVALAPRVKLVSSTKTAFLLTALASWTLHLLPAGDLGSAAVKATMALTPSGRLVCLSFPADALKW